VSFLHRSQLSNDRLSYWGGSMGSRFTERQRHYARMAASRWGMVEPCPDDVMCSLMGEDWMQKCPGLASLITSYAIGGEE